MKIRILAKGEFTVSAIVEKDGTCPVFVDLTGGLPKQYERYGNTLLRKIELISENGFESLSSIAAHGICKNPKIYELIQGKLRLVFFHGKGEMVAVCTEIIVKKTQKVDPQVVERAKSAYKAYLQSIEDNDLYEIREEDNGTKQIIKIETGRSKKDR